MCVCVTHPFSVCGTVNKYTVSSSWSQYNPSEIDLPCFDRIICKKALRWFSASIVPRLYNYADLENTDKKTTLNAEEDVKEDTGEKQKRQKETCLNRVEKAFGKTIESE